MSYTTDHDGKSKTASGVDADHYPEQNEVKNLELEKGLPGHAEISKRAFEIWIERGRPKNSEEHDWRQAEDELRSKSGASPVLVRESGSVQS